MCDKPNLSIKINPLADLICIARKSVTVSDWPRAQYATASTIQALERGLAVTFRSVWGSKIWTPTSIFVHSGGF